MATMVSEVYDALLEAGASQEKARKAAEAVANYETRFSKLEQDNLLPKWMIAFNLGISVALLMKAYLP